MAPSFEREVLYEHFIFLLRTVFVVEQLNRATTVNHAEAKLVIFG